MPAPEDRFFKDSYFETSDRPVKLRGCDCPGCELPGDFRAPKSRDHLNDYYWFCLDHVRDYNRQWDYFVGMTASDIEDHLRSAVVWERPSWPISGAQAREQHIRDEIMREFFADDARTEAFQNKATPKAERDALLILELTPPADFKKVKAQYRILVKRHHPDANGGSPESEEKFKNISQAFAVLKQLYGMDEA